MAKSLVGFAAAYRLTRASQVTSLAAAYLVLLKMNKGLLIPAPDGFAARPLKIDF